MSDHTENLKKLIGQLREFHPWNEQEARDRNILIDAVVQQQEAVFQRSSVCSHMTASAWVISPDVRKVLMAYHNLYKSWSWLGGHADGETDLLKVAVKEVQEESGLKNVVPVSDGIYSVEVLTVEGHEKRGEYVSSHLHLNVTYLLMADPQEPVRIKEDENSGVRWFATEEAPAMSSEAWFRERIYSKLNSKLQEEAIKNQLRTFAENSPAFFRDESILLHGNDT